MITQVIPLETQVEIFAGGLFSLGCFGGTGDGT